MESTEQDRPKEIGVIQDSLDVLKKIAASKPVMNGETPLADYIEELRQKLSSEDVYLATLGLFKRGKSTLINALLQSDVLPSGVVPVTSVITKVRYAEVESATIFFGDGQVKEVPLSELSAFVTEKGNPGNVRRVREACVSVRSPFLRENDVTIIDTPGVGSTYLEGTEATYRFLESVDASLFVLAVDPPISKEEVELLTAATKYAKKTVFVLNKKDYVAPDILQEALDFCRQVIQSSLALEDVKVQPVSAKLALEGYLSGDRAKTAQSGITELKSTLRDVLGQERQDILVASVSSKSLEVARGLSVSQEIAIKSARMPLGELEQALVAIDTFLRSMDSRAREIFYLLDGKSKEIVQTLDEDLARFKTERGPEFVAMMESFARGLLASNKGSSRQITNEVESKLRESLRDAYSDFLSSETPKIDERFVNLVNTFNSDIEGLAAEARRKMSSALGIDMEGRTRDIDLVSEHKFYFRIDPLFRSDPMLMTEIPTLLPKFMFKGTFLKKVTEKAAKEFDSTAGRIRYDYFMVRLDKGLIELKRNLRQYLDGSILTARNAMAEGSEIRRLSEAEMERKLSGLRETQERIRTVERNLEELLLSRERTVAKPQEV